MTRTASALVAAAAGLAVCSTANAEIPAVLDYVPADSIYVAISNVQDLLTDISMAGQQLGDVLPPEAGMALGMLGMGQAVLAGPGIDAAGSAAVVVLPGAGGEDEWTGEPTPGFVGVLPINDLEAFANSPILGPMASDVKDGMMTMDMQGMALFIRSVGDFAVVGIDEEIVKGFGGEGGHTAAHEKLLGAVGETMAAANDIMIAAPVAAFAEPLEEQLAMAEQQLAMFAMMGGAGAEAETFTQALSTVAKSFIRDGEVGLAGVQIDADGVTLHMGANFEEGSELAGFFASGSDSSAHLAKLPDVPFLLTGSLDTEAAGLRRLFTNAMELLPEPPEGAPDIDPMAQLNLSKGGAFVIGTTPAITSGIFNNTISYAPADDPAALAAQLKKDTLASDGASQGGMKYAVTVDEDDREVAGVTVDSYKMTISQDPDAAPAMAMMDPSQVMAVMFGGSMGPSGYIAETESGVYTTFGKNSRILESSLKAEGGEGQLTSSDLVKGVAAKLPEGRVAEAYVAVDQLANAVGPFAAMVGMGDVMADVDEMPPIGLSIATDDGGTIFSIHLPETVLGFFAEIAEAQAGAGGGFDGGDDDGPRF